MKKQNQSKLYSFLRYALVILIATGASSLFAYKTNEDKPQEPIIQTKETEQFYSSPVIPDIVTFAGDTVPIEFYDVYESLDRELLVNSYWHTNTILVLKRSKKYFKIIEPILKEENIPSDFKYLPAIESSFQNATSPAGAKGIWQFMKATAKEYGLSVNSEVDERYDYEKSTRAACKYLRKMYAKLGNWSLVAAAYNRGQNGLRRALDRQQVDSYYDLYLNSETARYVYRIIAFKYIFETPKNYGFDIPDSVRYDFPECQVYKVDTVVNDLPGLAVQLGSNYKQLKYLNPSLLKSSLTLKENMPYFIKLPLEDSRKLKH